MPRDYAHLGQYTYTSLCRRRRLHQHYLTYYHCYYVRPRLYNNLSGRLPIRPCAAHVTTYVCCRMSPGGNRARQAPKQCNLAYSLGTAVAVDESLPRA